MERLLWVPLPRETLEVERAPVESRDSVTALLSSIMFDDALAHLFYLLEIVSIGTLKRPVRVRTSKIKKIFPTCQVISTLTTFAGSQRCRIKSTLDPPKSCRFDDQENPVLLIVITLKKCINKQIL